MEQLKDIDFSTVSSIWKDFVAILPTVIGVVLVLFAGWLLNKIIRFIVKKLLRLPKISQVTNKLNEARLFGEGVGAINIEKIILTFVKWMILLISIIIAADIAELNVISNEIANLLHYLPILFSAVVIFIIGVYAANLIKKMLVGVFESMQMAGTKIVSGIIFYILVIFVAITALNHAGINTEIVTNNFTLVLGAFLLAFALAFGLGSREVVADLLRTFYARKSYSVGDRIKLKDIEGIIQAIDSISVTLKTEDGKILVIPIKEFIENRIEIK